MNVNRNELFSCVITYSESGTVLHSQLPGFIRRNTSTHPLLYGSPLLSRVRTRHTVTVIRYQPRLGHR